MVPVWRMKTSHVVLPFAALLLALTAVSPHAQSPGVPIESGAPLNQNKVLLGKLAALRDGKRAMDTAAAKAALEKPVPAAVALPVCRTTALRPAEVWQSAQRSMLRVGWHYLCHKCEHWHVNLAGGYPLTEDGVVATCFHVAEPGAEIREGQLVAVDSAGEVYPVTAVLARSRTMDACLLRVEGLKCEPLPLNDQVRPGDSAFLLSTPLEVSGYFTDGIVNRFYWNPKTMRNPPAAAEGESLKHLRLNVSTDWAPGSSGSPVLDTCGNVMGHVATISHLGDGKNSDGKGVPHLTLHEAIPARSLRWLAEQSTRLAAAPLPEPEPAKALPEPATDAPADPQ
jgi:S1-C subfamily serine protease